MKSIALLGAACLLGLASCQTHQPDIYRTSHWNIQSLENRVAYHARGYQPERDRPYGELAGLTISIWYYQDLMCELEPIGPSENIPPGGEAAFTEDWWLLPYDYPRDGGDLDLAEISALVEREAR